MFSVQLKQHDSESLLHANDVQCPLDLLCGYSALPGRTAQKLIHPLEMHLRVGVGVGGGYISIRVHFNYRRIQDIRIILIPPAAAAAAAQGSCSRGSTTIPGSE